MLDEAHCEPENTTSALSFSVYTLLEITNEILLRLSDIMERKQKENH